jgi:hypothetical protein
MADRTRPPRRRIERGAGPLPGTRQTGMTAGRVLAVVGLTALGMVALSRAAKGPPRRPPRRHPPAATRARAARLARRGAATLAGSVLLDSALEHFRGNYRNSAMYAAPAVAGAALAASTGDAAGSRGAVRPRDAVHGAAAATGLLGLGFHVYNIAQRPGGLTTMNNWFYAAPIGAPGALMGAGLIGLAAGRLDRPASRPPRREARALGLFTALSLLATSAEVALLHFRGAFHNRAMYVPLVVPPATALALAAAVLRPRPPRLRAARRLCRLTAAVGGLGVGFHAYGVHRNHGGWYNWRQNMLQGPPTFAPPAFVGLGLVGLGALELAEAGRRSGPADTEQPR